MTSIDVSTDDFPAHERLTAWQDFMSDMLAPMELRSDDPSAFAASARVWPVGAAAVARVASASMELHRTARMIRQSDPEVYQLTLAHRGSGGVEQGRRQATLSANELVIWDTSRPLHGWSVSGERPALGAVVVLPRASLPLPAGLVRRLAATRLPGDTVTGRLLIQFVTTLTTSVDDVADAEATRLGRVLADLLAAYIAGLLDARRALPPETREAALLLAIDDFITRRLRDPALSPAGIAASHHISVRYLHKLYAAREDGLTVSATIRLRRLEECHRDLADASGSHRPVHQVAASWGFRSESHFSRLFKETYGVSPSAVRHSRPCAQGQPMGTHRHGRTTPRSER
ncbi:helix-turn-helix domain-containing protein [Actinoplanes sp. TBRC 11911]|uniref:AraC-like ligand-binding domain-containing protein n=1 Tax=Actinoplanes sp. TBRC 11911 TaxID=2729386 RepID=UPI00145DD820|nr:helix-turn-helix domain-containing protein [Actinoplanes sp. TBRC 11911]NMO53960.1 helix-turn-helix domain-containing protein [Actinoplanes sp. TBRC 11911]